MDSPDGTEPEEAGSADTPTTYGPGFWMGTALAALVGAAIGVFFVLPFGLVVIEYVIFPLALGVGAILASVGASWVGNRLAPDHTRTVLSRVAGVTAAVAVVLAAVFLANAALRLVLLGPVFYVGLFCVLALALTATLSTGRFRTHQGDLGDGRLALWLLLLAIVSVPVVIFVAWLAGLAGA